MFGTSAVPALAQPAASPPARPAFIDSFWEPFERDVIAALRMLPGMRVLAAGCGTGTHLGLFAKRLRGRGEVTGLDLREDRLETARRKFAGNKQITLKQGDLYKLPFPGGTFDVAWASHVFHGLRDIDAAARELARVVRPGGVVVLRENRSNLLCLPLDCGTGTPGLEGRLHEAFHKSFVENRLKLGRYPFGWTHALEQAGLASVEARSILHEARPPLREDQKQYLAYFLRSRLQCEGVSEEDRQTVLAITDPAHPAYALNRPDLYVTAVSTIYIGHARS